MNKQELMETYTAEQLAEMVVEMESVLEEKTTKCKPTEDGEMLKIKCDKCREDFIAFLDDKYILCTKAELFSTREMNNTLKREAERLQSENENLRKALKEEREKRDCQIAEYRNRTEKDKTELERAENTINQIDDILKKLFGVRHDTVDKPDEFEKILTEKAKGNVSDFLQTEPIKVADMLINAEGEYEHNPLVKAIYKEDKGTYRIFDIGDLRQIAEHLLVYCNHHGEVEE